MRVKVNAGHGPVAGIFAAHGKPGVRPGLEQGTLGPRAPGAEQKRLGRGPPVFYLAAFIPYISTPEQHPVGIPCTHGAKSRCNGFIGFDLARRVERVGADFRTCGGIGLRRSVVALALAYIGDAAVAAGRKDRPPGAVLRELVLGRCKKSGTNQDHYGFFHKMSPLRAACMSNPHAISCLS